MDKFENQRKESQTKDTEMKLDYDTLEEKNTNKKRKKVKMEDSFSSRKLKNGAYSTLITTVIIIMVLIVNLIFSQLDLKIDLSKEAMYTLTKETTKLAKGLKDDIVIYYIASEKTANSKVQQIVDKYDSISDHLSVVMKDPVLYPKFTTQYVSDDVVENSVIVVNNSNNKFKYVPYSDMFQYEYDSNYNATPTGIDVEGQITSALSYVTQKNLPKVYTIGGHGETEINTTLASNLEKQNVTTETLNTLSAESIPKDCSILLINAPQHDYTENEVKIIEDYLKSGGDAIILVSYTKEEMPKFNSLLDYYGISLAPGIVIEGDSNSYMSGYPTYVIPKVESNAITSSVSTKKMPIVVPIAKGIKISKSLRSTLTVDPLLTTTDKAISKTNVNSSTIEKEKGDVDGPFNLSVSITENNNKKETKIVVFGSSYLIDEEMLNYTQLGNSELFMSSVNSMSEQPSALSIPVRSLNESYLTVNSSQVKFWGSFVVFLIPVILIGAGTFVLFRRRRR